MVKQKFSNIVRVSSEAAKVLFIHTLWLILVSYFQLVVLIFVSRPLEYLNCVRVAISGDIDEQKLSFRRQGARTLCYVFIVGHFGQF